MGVGSRVRGLSISPVRGVERLGVIMRPRPDDPTEAWGVLNPAVIRGRDGETYLFARVVAAGNVSRIRKARVLFDAAGRPAGLERLGFALEPEAPYERRGTSEGGCEDPRITYLPLLDRYVMAYTGFGPRGARVALAVSHDLHGWERLGLAEFGEQDNIDFDGFDN
ncbi:MAG: glycosidase, partial [Chloroflexi bacterium]|nr:glycosidase [Chloroflexota bacterium]